MVRRAHNDDLQLLSLGKNLGRHMHLIALVTPAAQSYVGRQPGMLH